jgi:hypothetical protein
MRSRARRASVAWIVAAVMAAPAWGTCASALTLLGSPATCPMRTSRDCSDGGPRAGARCCLVDTQIPASNVPVATASTPLKLLPALDSVNQRFALAAGSERGAFIDARAPLKIPKRPTYLRLSALLI